MCMGVLIDDEMCEPVTPDIRPVYSISIAAELLDVHQQTLRIYEEKGIVIPARRSTRRFYSDRDLYWIRIVRFLLHEKHVCLTGLQRMLGLTPCWEILGCGVDARAACPRSRQKSSACWVVAPRVDEKCYMCPVYRHAAEHICDEDELVLAMSPPLSHD